MYHLPSSIFVADFLGRSNFINGEVTSVSGNDVVLKSNVGLLPAKLDSKLQVGDRASLAIRPERIQVSLNEPILPNRFVGEITDATFLGGQLDLDIDIMGEQLSASVPAVQVTELGRMSKGSKVWVGWNTSAARALPLSKVITA